MDQLALDLAMDLHKLRPTRDTHPNCLTRAGCEQLWDEICKRTAYHLIEHRLLFSPTIFQDVCLNGELP